MKKFVSILLTTLLYILSFTACSGEPTQTNDTTSQNSASGAAGSDMPVDLVFTGIGFNTQNGIDPGTGKEFIGWEEFADTTFKESFPNVNLKVESIPWDNFSAKMQTILQANNTDIVYASSSFNALFHKEGLLTDLNQFMDKDDSFVFEDFYPASLRNNLKLTDYTGEKLIALPYILGYRIIIYDKQIFDDWGVENLSERPTIEEILEKAEKMTGINPKTGKQNYGAFFSGAAPNMSPLLNIGYQYGVVGCEGTLDNLSGLNWSLNSPELIKSVSAVCNLSKYCPPTFINDNGFLFDIGTVNNDIAIAIDIPGGKIINEYNSTGDNTILERYEPVYSLGKNGEGWADVDGIAMSGHIDESKKDIAWEVIKYLAGPEASRWFYDQFGPLPMAVKDDSFYPEEDKYIRMNSKVIENSHSSVFEEMNPFFVSDIQPTIAALMSRAALGESIDYQDELNKLQNKAEAWSENQLP